MKRRRIVTAVAAIAAMTATTATLVPAPNADAFGLADLEVCALGNYDAYVNVPSMHYGSQVARHGAGCSVNFWVPVSGAKLQYNFWGIFNSAPHRNFFVDIKTYSLQPGGVYAVKFFGTTKDGGRDSSVSVIDITDGGES